MARVLMQLPLPSNVLVSHSPKPLSPQAAVQASRPGSHVDSMGNGDEPQRLTIAAPDDWHLHLRDGDALASVAPHRLTFSLRSMSFLIRVCSDLY